jgi:hypothetical protein
MANVTIGIVAAIRTITERYSRPLQRPRPGRHGLRARHACAPPLAERAPDWLRESPPANRPVRAARRPGSTSGRHHRGRCAPSNLPSLTNSRDLAHDAKRLARVVPAATCPEPRAANGTRPEPAGLRSPPAEPSPFPLRPSPTARLDKTDTCMILHYSPYAAQLWARAAPSARKRCVAWSLQSVIAICPGWLATRASHARTFG